MEGIRLSPDGKLIPLKNMNHGDYAQRQGTDIEGLWKAGYFRITFYGDKLYAHNEFNVDLNYRQKSELINYAIESGFTHVVVDMGHDERVIWSAFDQV